MEIANPLYNKNIEVEDKEILIRMNVTTQRLLHLEHAMIHMDFTQIDSQFKYGDHYALVLLVNGSIKQAMPAFFTNSSTNKQSNMTLSVMNFKEDVVEFKIQIELYHGLFKDFLKDFANTVTFEKSKPYRAIYGTDKLFAIALHRDYFEDFALPYNFPDV